MAIYTISDRYGFRGGSQPLVPGEGYRIIYVPSQPISPDRLVDLGAYLEPRIAPCEFKGALLDGDELEITVQAKSGCAQYSTRWLYDQVVQGVEDFLAGAPATETPPEEGTTGGTAPATAMSWLPWVLLGGLLAFALWQGRK